MNNCDKLERKSDYLESVFVNDYEHAKIILKYYQEIMPSKIQELRAYLNENKPEQFFTLTRQIMISFTMIGFPEISSELNELAIEFKNHSKPDTLVIKIKTLLFKIAQTLPVVDEELKLLESKKK